jgi:hypothetical protein
MLSTQGVIQSDGDIGETSYLAMNILVNLVSNANGEICAQAAAKINSVLHNKPVVNFEEACHLLANIDAVIIEHLNNGK